MAATHEQAHRRWARITLALAALYWVFDLALLRAGTPEPLDDLWEYGVAARALLEGHPFRTFVIHPPLWGLRDAALSVPILIHGPLLPMLLAPLLALFGPGMLMQSAWLAALAAWATAALLFRLGERRGGAPMGAAAALVWTLSPLTLQSVHHDIALPVGALLFTCALDLITRKQPRALAAGVALGLAWLARPEMLLAAPLFALFAGRTALPLLAGFALAAAPWVAHQWSAAGQPFFNLSSYILLGYWGAYPELSPLRDFALTPQHWPDVLRESLPRLDRKWLDFAPRAVKRAVLAPSGGTGWLASLGFLLGVVLKGDRRVGWLALALSGIPVLVQTLTVFDSRYIVPFMPLWALAVAQAALWLGGFLPAWGRRPRTVLALLLMLMLPSIGPALKDATNGARRWREHLAELRAELAPYAARPGVIEAPLISNRPDFAAWTTRRSVVWLERREYLRLPATGEPNPRDLPVRGEARNAWFEGEALDGATAGDTR